MPETPRIPIPTQFAAPEFEDRPPLPHRPLTECDEHCMTETPGVHCMNCPRAAYARIPHEVEPQHDRPDDAPERDAEAVAATPAAPAPPAGAPPLDETVTPFTAPAGSPVPLAAGTYAIYADGQGGYVMVAQTSDGAVHHKHIPARIVKMAEMAMGGNSPLAGLFGG